MEHRADCANGFGGEEIVCDCTPKKSDYDKGVKLGKVSEKHRIYQLINGFLKEEYYSCPRPTCRDIQPEACEHIFEWQYYNKAINDIKNHLNREGGKNI